MGAFTLINELRAHARTFVSSTPQRPRVRRQALVA